MAWVTWRQQRATLISLPAVLGTVAVFLLIAGLKVHHDYAAIVNCPLGGPHQSTACANNLRSFNSTDWTLGNTCAILMSLAPVLIGAFAGAPVLAKELETGTFRYAWTQGFARTRQTIAKLALLGVAIAILAWAFGELFGWFFHPFLYIEQRNPLSDSVFETSGIVFPAFALVSFAIGAFLGMLIRRVIPALAATLGVYLLLSLGAWALHGQYPVSVVTSDTKLLNAYETPSLPGFPWILNTWYTGPGGKPASQSVINQYLSNPNARLPKGYTTWNRYIPLSHYWPMQLIEAGWLLVLAVALTAATVWLVRHRAA
ncbi:MAG: ABC transporter permease subunit, partial [Trebonia sp.]